MQWTVFFLQCSHCLLFFSLWGFLLHLLFSSTLRSIWSVSDVSSQLHIFFLLLHFLGYLDLGGGPNFFTLSKKHHMVFKSRPRMHGIEETGSLTVYHDYHDCLILQTNPKWHLKQMKSMYDVILVSITIWSTVLCFTSEKPEPASWSSDYQFWTCMTASAWHRQAVKC